MDRDNVVSIFACDIDGDGDLDVLSASYYKDQISWFENLLYVGIEDNNLNSSDRLNQNYPNPFSVNTNISFNVKEHCLVKISVYDVDGRLISILVNEQMKPGKYSVNLNGQNLPSGTYFCNIQMNEFAQTRKILLKK
ncbi:MAG: T9SS type A sorting domain-containing protein [Bacteroidales bacterium]|nr:T9SS type A sorting domain-containing protein [Bacteroidales bacterium]